LITREEIDRLIIELYEAKKPYRVIAKEARVSPGYICSVIRRYRGEPEKEEKQQQQENELTIDTKVFKLFEEGKGPVQVAIDLNLPSTEVTRLQQEYWRLKGLQMLDDLYEDIKDEVFQFQTTYKLIKDEGYTPRQLIEVANHLDELPFTN
jgi:hypothetical protein